MSSSSWYFPKYIYIFSDMFIHFHPRGILGCGVSFFSFMKLQKRPTSLEQFSVQLFTNSKIKSCNVIRLSNVLLEYNSIWQLSI